VLKKFNKKDSFYKKILKPPKTPFFDRFWFLGTCFYLKMIPYFFVKKKEPYYF